MGTVCCCVSAFTDYPMITWLTRICVSLPCCVSRESKILGISSLGKDQNTKFALWFPQNAYHFHTIVKSKNRLLNHCKLETVCVLNKGDGSVTPVCQGALERCQSQTKKETWWLTG